MAVLVESSPPLSLAEIASAPCSSSPREASRSEPRRNSPPAGLLPRLRSPPAAVAHRQPCSSHLPSTRTPPLEPPHCPEHIADLPDQVRAAAGEIHRRRGRPTSYAYDRWTQWPTCQPNRSAHVCKPRVHQAQPRVKPFLPILKYPKMLL